MLAEKFKRFANSPYNDYECYADDWRRSSYLMVMLALSLNGVGYNLDNAAIIGTAQITTADWRLNPGFNYNLYAECREGSESGVGVGGPRSTSGHVGPLELAPPGLDFTFSGNLDVSKTYVVIATFINADTGQLIKRVTQSVPPPSTNGPPLPLPWPFGDIPIEYLIVGAGLVLVVVAAVVLSPKKKR